MAKINIVLTVGGNHETEVTDYNAQAIADEIKSSTETIVAIGDVVFNKSFFVSTSPVRIMEENTV